MFQSTKLYDGYSACFRQYKAEGTHCRYLHGYAISFKVTFEGELDERNWVFDFGGLKRSQILIEDKAAKDFFDYYFDHTVLIASDDPFLSEFEKLNSLGVLQLRVLERVGCEVFAQWIFNKLNPLVLKETNNRVKIKRVEVFEHQKNSAIYEQ